MGIILVFRYQGEVSKYIIGTSNATDLRFSFHTAVVYVLIEVHSFPKATPNQYLGQWILEIKKQEREAKFFFFFF